MEHDFLCNRIAELRADARISQRQLAKEVGFRKMLRESGAYKDLNEKVEAELDQLRRMEENDDFLLEEWEEMPEE